MLQKRKSLVLLIIQSKMAARRLADLVRQSVQGKNFGSITSDVQMKVVFGFAGRRWFASSWNANDFGPESLDTFTNETCLEKEGKTKQKLLKVAIIGEPNSGKSTLANSLVGEKVFAVTNKPHTTRQRAQGMFTRGSAQVVLLDTPGVVTRSEGRRLKMTREHVTAPENALKEADMIAVVSDAADKRTRYRLHEQLIEALSKHDHTPSFLILNKIDKLKQKTELLGLVTLLSEDREKDAWGYVDKGGWNQFDNIFMISAKSGDGIGDVKEYLSLKAKPGEWMFPPDSNTDLTLQQRIHEIFREKLLQLYEHEIPWQIKQVNVLCELRTDGQLRVHQKLYCRKKSQKRCVLEKLELLNEKVQTELEDIFGCKIDLSIDVGVSEKLGFQTPLPIY